MPHPVPGGIVLSGSGLTWFVRIISTVRGASRRDAVELAALQQHVAEARVVHRGREQAAATRRADRNHGRIAAADVRRERRPPRRRVHLRVPARASPSERRRRCPSSRAARRCACAGSRRTAGPRTSRRDIPGRRRRCCKTTACPAARAAAASPGRRSSPAAAPRVLSTRASMIIRSTGLFGFSVYPSPPVCVISSRIVIERRASSSFGVPSSFSPVYTLSAANSGMWRDTGSSSRHFPSSYSIIIATPVTGLVIDAMRKIESFWTGSGFCASRLADGC